MRQVSRDALTALVKARAFNATPPRHDLGRLHVPFESMVDGCHVESRLDDGARRGDRMALIGASGCGKSSLVSYVLGPTAIGVAPILVPVHALEDGAGRARSVADAVIAQLRLEAADETGAAESIDAAIGEQRQVTGASSRRRGLSGGPTWASGDLSKEISRQTANQEFIYLPEKVEVIEQCLRAIRLDALQPVVVFDDTDRWIDADHRDVVSGFFGEGIRWLADLDVSVVVATHANYLQGGNAAPDVLTFLDTRVEIPPVPSVDQLARILERRVQAHPPESAGSEAALSLADVLAEPALEELFSQYTARGSLRALLQVAHVALVEAADVGADIITSHHISAASQAR
jgi:hypothetical protein